MSIDPPCVRKKLLVEDIEIHHVSWSKGMCYHWFMLQPAVSLHALKLHSSRFNQHVNHSTTISVPSVSTSPAPCQVLQYVHGRTHFHFLGVSFELCTLGAREFSLVFLSMEKWCLLKEKILQASKKLLKYMVGLTTYNLCLNMFLPRQERCGCVFSMNYLQVMPKLGRIVMINHWIPMVPLMLQ